MIDNFQIVKLIKLPGYYCLNMDKRAFISLNDMVLRELVTDDIERAVQTRLFVKMMVPMQTGGAASGGDA